MIAHGAALLNPALAFQPVQWSYHFADFSSSLAHHHSPRVTSTQMFSTTYEPPQICHTFSNPLSSTNYESQFFQLFCFHTHPSTPGGGGAPGHTTPFRPQS